MPHPVSHDGQWLLDGSSKDAGYFRLEHDTTAFTVDAEGFRLEHDADPFRIEHDANHFRIEPDTDPVVADDGGLMGVAATVDDFGLV